MAGKGFSTRIASQASLINPRHANISIRGISSPAGQAALHGAVFSSNTGRRKRHDPVLLISVEMLEQDMNNGISSVFFGFNVNLSAFNYY
jgi:hypothetical protein